MEYRPINILITLGRSRNKLFITIIVLLVVAKKNQVNAAATHKTRFVILDRIVL